MSVYSTWDAGLIVERQLVTEPIEEPLTVAFVRDEHLRVANGSLEDTKIARLIRTAREYAEFFTGRALVEQTWKLLLSSFPASDGKIQLPNPPLIDVTGFTYSDGDGDTVTLDVSPPDFTIVKPSGPRAKFAYLLPSYGTSWPTARNHANSVSITFTCGYEAVGGTSTVPSQITDAMLLMIGELYKIRSESVHAIHNTPAFRTADNLLMPYKVY